MAIGLGAAIAGAAVSAGGSIAGGLIGKSGVKSAAEAQLIASREALAAQKDQFEASRKDLEPFRQSQLVALKQQAGLSDPNSQLYQQQRGMNTQAIQRQLAAQGLLRSKSQVDLLSNLELGLNQQRFGNINAIANNGAAQSIAGLRQNYGQQIASGLQQQGAINAQAAQQNASLGTGIISGINNSIQGGLQNMASQQYQSQILGLLAGQNNQQRVTPFSSGGLGQFNYQPIKGGFYK